MQNNNVRLWKEQYESTLKELQREQCVLLIGPDIVQQKGTSFQDRLKQELCNKFPDKIPFYYPKDALFVFKDEMSKASVQGKVVDYLEDISALNNAEAKPDETLYKKIAAVPFHLILSVNPDHYLSDTFAKYGVRHRFAYFHHSVPGAAEIEEPHDYMPLIYNLFGSKEKDASLVLDYDDLFSLLQSLLGNSGLPTKLESKLKEAKSFLFLGFRFDRWYSQLLLRLLAGKQAIRKYVLEDNPDTDTCTFLATQMGITFLGSDIRFFDLLYRLCENRKCLRELTEINNPAAQTIFQLIQKGDSGRAMQMMTELFRGTPAETEATQLAGRYAIWEKNRNLGLQNDRDAQVELNRILYSALQLVKSTP